MREPGMDTARGRSGAQRAATAECELHEREHDRIIAEAKSREDQGRYAESFALIRRALDTAPDNPDLLAARGATLYAWGRFREARDAFRLAEVSGLRSARLYRMLG